MVRRETELLDDEVDEAPAKEAGLGDTQELDAIDTVTEEDAAAQDQIAEGLDRGAEIEARKKLDIINAENLEDAKGLLDADQAAAIEWAEDEAEAVFQKSKINKSDIAVLRKTLEGKGSRLYEIEDKDVRVALGKLLVVEVRQKIDAKKVEMEKEREDGAMSDDEFEGFKEELDRAKKEKENTWDSGEVRKMTEEEVQEAIQQSDGNSAELPSSAIAGAEDAQARFSERMENIKDGIVQDSRGENRQKRLAFINKQKSFWTRFRMRLGFISDTERIMAEEES